jgi:hypothetical protein
MRRILWDYVFAALERQRTDLECFIAERLECSDAFPLDLAKPTACTCETQRLKIRPQARADYPPVLVTVSLRVLITATTTRRETARGVRTAAVPEALLGRRTLSADVEVCATGLAVGSGYEVTLRRARLIAWWGCSEPAALSQ